MPDPMLETPLHGHDLPAMARPMDSSQGAWASEVPGLGFITLRGSLADPAFSKEASEALGVTIPAGPCTLVRSDKLDILWLSPDEWMLVAPRAEVARLLDELRTALAGVRCQIVDNSGGFTKVRLRGRHAGDVMSHVTVYDIHALTHGRIVGTTLGKSSVYLHREDGGFALLVRRSFADYVWRFLVRAAAPYGFGVIALDGHGTAGPSGADP